MSRFALILLTFLAFFSSDACVGSAQLQTLSRGNADLQWRDAQVKECDKTTGGPQIARGAKAGIEGSTRLVGQMESQKLEPTLVPESNTPNCARNQSSIRSNWRANCEKRYLTARRPRP